MPTNRIMINISYKISCGKHIHNYKLPCSSNLRLGILRQISGSEKAEAQENT